jgi:hypothetical protein
MSHVALLEKTDTPRKCSLEKLKESGHLGDLDIDGNKQTPWPLVRKRTL